MTMTRKERFRLKSQLTERLDSTDWPGQKIDLLLAEFGLGPHSPSPAGKLIVDIVSKLSDAMLVEMYSIVFEVDPQEVVESVESTDAGNWKPGFTRVFLSHSSEHNKFVSQVADELAVVGIHGFVAHEAMTVSEPWQRQVEAALRSMEAFVAFSHPKFNQSPWCNQEAGWALGRRVPHFTVRFGVAPAGFLGSTQWPNGSTQTTRQVADTIYRFVADQAELGRSIIDGLLGALERAGDFVSAGAAAERIARLGTLSPEDFTRLDTVYWKNDQIYGAVLANRELKPFYESHSRTFPPPKPVPRSAAPEGTRHVHSNALF